MEETEDQTKNSHTDHLKPWQFKPGQTGNANGRPKGSVSLKTWAKNYLQTLPDEEKREFLSGLDKIDLWKMAEGNPAQGIQTDVKGEITFRWPTDGDNHPLPTENVSTPPSQSI